APEVADRAERPPGSGIERSRGPDVLRGLHGRAEPRQGRQVEVRTPARLRNTQGGLIETTEYTEKKQKTKMEINQRQSPAAGVLMNCLILFLLSVFFPCIPCIPCIPWFVSSSSVVTSRRRFAPGPLTPGRRPTPRAARPCGRRGRWRRSAC